MHNSPCIALSIVSALSNHATTNPYPGESVPAVTTTISMRLVSGLKAKRFCLVAVPVPPGVVAVPSLRLGVTAPYTNNRGGQQR
jgi:hypothetical protein